MPLSNWLKSLFKRPAAPPTMVPFYDGPSGRVTRIPASELRPGCVRVRIEGLNEVVWILPEQLQQSPIRHPPFDEDLRSYIREIQAAFAEHRPLSLEQWEEGFRRDADPQREIAIFSYAADVYRLFTETESSAERRREIYRILVACMNASPESVWHVITYAALSKPEVERLVHRFYGGEKVGGPLME